MQGSARAGESITVSAGATMTEAMQELAASFEKQHGVQVACNFGASGQLLQQIAQGAPVDVFASADQATMDKALAQNLIVPDTRRDFARNRLVLITPAGSRPLTALKDLTRLERIAVGNPDFVPIGRYTRKALEPDGLWQELAPRFVMGVTVRQVLDYVARGEAEAGFVFATDALVAGAKVQSQSDILPPQPISYPAAVLSQSTMQPAARAFVAFLAGAEGQAILARHGFIPLE
ncbi:MAG: molybdate ABC transporter substrate-binding protein [Desulfobulbaceae bacterium A2]|nr:MAG: molybdate ABC transporter substrate-binding protein [Desulfobulbaceae bacterium A2]